MKIAKKTLSVFLSLLMIFGTCSVCLTGFSFSASAASSYTTTQVKNLVSAAAAKAASTSSSSNAWNYTGDDGTVLAAAEAVFDYAVNSVRTTGTTSSYNSTDTIYNRMLSVLGYASSSNEAKFIKNVLYPTGTTTYGYPSRKSQSGSWEDQSSLSNGTNLTNNGNVSYNTSVTTSVTKTASVTVDVNAYLLTFATIDDIPSSFPTKITYKFVNTSSKTASQTSQSSRTEGMWWWKETYYTHNWTSYIWNYMSATPTRTPNSTNTTAKSTLQSYANYFTAERLATTAADLLGQTGSELEALYNEGVSKYNGLKGAFASSVVTHFFDTAAIEAYLDEVQFAMQVVLAQPNMKTMMEYIANGYDANNYDEMSTLYTNASAVYNTIKDYDPTVFAFVIANYEGFDGFSLDASKAFLDTLYYDMELYQLRQIKAAVDADIAANEAKFAEGTDPLDHAIISNEELAALKDKFNGYVASIAQFSTAAQNAVFTDGLGYIADFRTAVQDVIDVRNEEIVYEPYYETLLPLIFANIERYTNEEIQTRYDADIITYNKLLSAYNKAVTNIGSELTDRIYTFEYEGQSYLLTTATADYIARLKQNIIDRNNAQLDAIKDYAGMSSTVNFSNFIGLKTAIDRFDQSLYDYTNGKGWVDSAHKATYNSITSLLTAYNNFVASGGLPYTQTHYHDASGLYTTRYAGDQVDADGNQIGYPSDAARDGADDNYDVTIAKVNQTITKLDDFITSEDFCNLVGLENKETGEAYPDLSTAIEAILTENIFTNEMVNTLVALLFPMVCNELGGMLADLGSLGVNGITKSNDPQSAGKIDLGVLSGGSAEGKIDVYLNGNKGTASLASDFESIGVYAYPNSLAKVLPAKYSAIKSALNAAGTDWSRLVGADGKTELTFDWGVTDYNSFVEAVGAVFNSILPLLQTVLAGANFGKSLPDKAVFATSDGNLKIDSGTFVGKITLYDVEAYATADLNITGLTIYKDLWIPLMEALGVTDGGYDLTDLGISGSYAFKSLSTSSSAQTMVNALFEPVLVVIEQLKQAPINKVLEILPQLVYALSMDKMQDLIDAISIPLDVKLRITNVENVSLVKIFGWSPDMSWIANLLLNTINGLLPQINQTLSLADLVNLKDMLGFEYTNINTLLAYLMETLGVDLQLPAINAGEIILCSSYNQNASSYRTGGKRLKLTADKADVFYFLLTYLVNAVGDRQFVENIIQFIQNSNAEEGEESEPVELPEAVYTIIGNVNSNPKAALAALVELFVPQRYDTEDFDWFESDFNYGDVQGLNDESIVYLAYRNDWTKDKANYLVDNVDAILESVMAMTGSEETSINAMLQKVIEGLFNNKNFTGLVKGLVSLGVSLKNDFLYDLIAREMGVDLRTWYNAFGYLFPEVDEKYGTTAPQPGEAGYQAIAGVTATAADVTNEETGEVETVITWTINGTEFTDGDRVVFLDLFTKVCDAFAPIISMFLKGEDLSLFNNAITVFGYENYANSIGMIFEMLSIEGVMTQAEYNAYCETNGDAAAFNYLTNQLFDWVDYMLEGNTVKKTLELIPEFIYFIQSNGISTVLHNLLMPILVLLDDVRPIVNVDINAILSLIVSDLISYGSVDFNKVLDLISGTYAGETDPEYKYFAIDLGHITLDEVFKIADTFFGTDLFGSQLVTHGLNGLCAGRVAYDSVIGKAYTTTVDVADTVTIFVTSLLEALQYEVRNEDGTVIGTNGEIICSFVDSKLDEPVALDVYNAVVEIIGGLEISYDVPNWGYMFSGAFTVGESGKVTLPPHSIVYLGYNNDWNKETAETLDQSLDTLVDTLVASLSDEDLKTLIDGVLNDNVYTDANLNTVVEMLVNALAGLDETLRDLVDCIVTTDIGAWFDMCELTTDEEGNETYVCTKDWGIDAAAEADKKDLFISGIQEVLEPAESLLSWIFFGTDYAFFTGTEKDADGNYTYNDVITLNGGEGYKWAIIPLFEALGCEMKPAETYDNGDGTYDVGAAVADTFNSLLDKVDSIAGKPAAEVMELLPNLIYFINADGLKVSVNNLLAPVNAVVEALAPIVSDGDSDVSIGGLLEESLGFNISDLTMDTLLTLLSEQLGLVLNPEMVAILETFYIGELTQFTSANGEYAYKMTYTDEESRRDMITIVLSFALDIVNLNDEMLTELLGEETYNAIVTLLAGHEGSFDYADNNWAYMYGGDIEKLRADNLPAASDLYNKYANDWSEVTADTLNENLADLIDYIFEASGKSDSTIGTMINEAVAGNLYSDKVLNSLVESVVGLLTGLDRSLVDSVGALLGADVNAWFDCCDITTDDDGNTVVTCTKDWGIDSAEDKEAAFVAAFTEAIAPANRVIAWLFFGQNYTFLTGTTKSDLITISGGEGYAYGLVPILEALGCEMKPADDYKNADGTYDVNAAVADVLTALLARVDDICSGKSGETVDKIIALLPNIIYFVNADGIKTSVNNLLAPVYYLLDTLEPVTGEVDFNELIGFDLNNLNWDTIFGILKENLGITLLPECQEFIKTFYIGSVEEKTSANGRQYFVMNLGDARRDMITIVLSVALETLENPENSTAFADLFGEETYNAIVALLAGAESLTYQDINWAYMYEGEDALEQLIANGLPARTGTNSIVYTQYTNYWTKASADYLNDNLTTIVEGIVAAAKNDGSTIGAMLDAAITDGLYKDEILDKLLVAVVKALAGLDKALVESVGAVLGADIDTWFDWCDITYDEDGNVVDVVCTKDWGIDAKATNEEKRDQFVASFVEALAPANRILAWICFGEEYTFLNGATQENLITIEGGEGYAYGIVPILEALGCEDVKPASYYYDDGAYDVSAALGDVLTAICGRLTDMCDGIKGGTLDVMLDMLPNVVYFINAGGVKASVNNILAPVYYLLETLSPLVGDVNIDELIGFPLSDLTFDTIFDIVGDKVGLYFKPECEEFVSTFYMGKVVPFTSANGQNAYYMTYSDTETRRDMITILLSLVIDTMKYEDNEAILSKWFGADVYKAIANVLGLNDAKAMQEFSWYYTEAANTDQTFTAIQTSGRYTNTYNEYWTKDKAQYLVDNLPAFIGNMLCLLGLEVDGVKLNNIEALISQLVDSAIYTQANADALLNAVRDGVGQLTSIEPYGEYVAEVLRTSIGLDLHAWDTMTVTVTDGDRVSFTNALAQILEPAAPLLKLLLANEDISLFFDINGGNAVTIPGSEGYAYGIIPLLEALQCENVRTPDEFKALLATDFNTAFKAVVDPLFDKIDAIEANPIDEIMALLPGVIYFINSNGLDTCFKNIVNSVDTVLAALEPVLGTSDLESLMGIDLSTYDFEWILNYALTAVKDSTGYDLTPFAADAIAELTVGKVVTYESKNGETYYTMKYASKLDKADMLTILLRIVIDFATMDENIAKIEAILKEYIPNEENYNSVCSLLESLAKSASEDPGMGQALYVLYYIFVGLSESAEATDDLYHDVNNSWQFILKMLDTSEEPILNNFSKTLKGVLNKYFDGIFTDEGVAPNGFIRFFQKLAELFKKIGEFFRSLFNRG